MGLGLCELGIMYDEKYERDEYELLAVLHDEECAEENMPPVIAQPDWDEYIYSAA